MKTAVLFDLDGTLIDSLADIAGALNAVLGELGLPQPTLDEYRYLVGYGAAELVRGALPEDRREALEADVLARYRARYRASLVAETQPYDGIEALLEVLEARAVPKAIVTNKPHDASVELVERLLGRFRWDVVLGQREGIPHKPDPAGALEVARAIGVEPAACFFVGDTDTDMRTATSAGMIAVGCLWGFRGREELERCGARHVIAHPSELLALVTR
ncbi:MAG: HAD family hydrolase [Myxococcota bacterium]|nr:HAD family hydrolase [Myxococcota bacterium]